MESLNEQNNVIVVDDDQEWCEILSGLINSLGYKVDAVHSLEEAKLRVSEADQKNQPYRIATLDMNFETGKSGVDMPRGKEMLKFIKSRYPYIACVMISGAGKNYDEIIDLRDDYDLDYFLAKERVEMDKLAKAFERARRRVDSVNPKIKQEKIRSVLKKWEETQIALLDGLAEVKKKKAKEGLDVSIRTLNEIKEYELELEEAERKIEWAKKEIDVLV